MTNYDGGSARPEQELSYVEPRQKLRPLHVACWGRRRGKRRAADRSSRHGGFSGDHTGGLRIALHADAQHAAVGLVNGSQGVELSVSDHGFEPAAITAGHFGLRIMRERAEAIGGLRSIDSEAGAGTRGRVVWNNLV